MMNDNCTNTQQNCYYLKSKNHIPAVSFVIRLIQVSEHA